MNKRNLFATAASLFASLLSACADPPPLYGDKPVTSGGTMMPPPPPPPDMAMSPYPEGPYGTQPGDTLFDIDLPGYRLDKDHTDSTALAWEDHITLASVRNAYPKAKCIWLALDAFW